MSKSMFLALLGAATLGSSPVQAATTITVGTVDDLISALKTNLANSAVIELRAGDYQLTDATAWMGKTDEGKDDSTPGKSHLFANGVRIKGLGATPEETRLIGAGTTYRVIRLYNAILQNLTVTNGYATAQTDCAHSARDGGVYGGTVTNCLIIGNRAAEYGGGIGNYATIRASRIINNSAKHGGGVHQGYLYNCYVAGNKATNGNGGGIMTACTAYETTVVSNTATSAGGGIHLCTVVSNCTIACNSASSSGGVSINDPAVADPGSIYDSVISNNVATKGGGGGVSGAHLYGCVIVANRAQSSHGGGVFKSANVTNCLIAGNFAWASGGGIGSDTGLQAKCYDSIVSNNVANSGGGTFLTDVCGGVVVGNSATNGYGGGIYDTYSVSNCLIVGNFVSHGGGGLANEANYVGVCCDSVVSNNASAASGGGVYQVNLRGTHVSCNAAFNGAGGGIYGDSTSFATNCVIYGNVASNKSDHCYGGGVKNYRLYQCEIAGNASIGYGSNKKVGAAGGMHAGALYDCFVHDNYSSLYGGGVRAVTAYRTVIKNNVSPGDGPNARDADLVNCTVSGTSVYACNAEGTTFTDIGTEVTLNNNPHSVATLTDTLAVKSYFNLTNCLFAGNVLSGSSNPLFQGILKDSSRPSTLINCTIADNTYRHLLSCYMNETKTLTIRNCLFYGNKRANSTSADLEVDTGNVTSAGVRIDHVAYGTALMTDLSDYVSVAGTLYKFGAADAFGTVIGTQPMFCLEERDANHPYALRRSSRARGKGVYEAWMAGAYDRRGEGFARADDKNAVDLGCYQCWLQPDGLQFIIK